MDITLNPPVYMWCASDKCWCYAPVDVVRAADGAAADWKHVGYVGRHRAPDDQPNQVNR